MQLSCSLILLTFGWFCRLKWSGRRQLKNSYKMSLSQEQAGKKMDKLITSSLTQVGVSVAWGLVASLVFFKRKSWPIIVGTGFGVGAAYADISNEVNLNS